MAVAISTSPDSLLPELAVPFRATVVVVVYRIAPEDAPAYRSLIEARKKLRSHEGRVSIVIWDNGPDFRETGDLPEDVTYLHDPRNPGLAVAYNSALGIAAGQRSEWLITLDHDTVVPPDYLIRLAATSQQYIDRSDIGAIVPQIATGKKRLSPYHFCLDALPKWYPEGYRGVPGGRVFAFNSGAMIRVDALRQIGGYDIRFPVDHSDTVMFYKLHQHGKRVFVDGDVQLEHELSFIEIGRRQSPERYRRALLAESAFWDLHMNWLAGCERTARLLLRLLRHLIREDGVEFRRVTRQFLFLRLFRSRKTRLHDWGQSFVQLEQRTTNAPRSSEIRPRVSVCMAAHNGAKFVGAQLKSIFPQLVPGDEIVVVDDCSDDDTVARVCQAGDSRIRLFTHESNQGIVATFEDAIRCATGEILFLCDDDDVWASTKIERVLREFASRPDVQVVVSRVALIDESGHRLPDSRFNRHGRFVSGFWRNLFMNHYQGAAMAIRSSLAGRVLPFPRRKSFLHDVWIGTRNAAAGGETAFIDEPLVFYRRHSQNASQTFNLLRQLRVRIELLIAHSAHI